MSRGDKLLERMRRTKHGWRPADLEAAYEAAGFKQKRSTKHDGYYHPKYPHLRTTVTLSDPVKADYVVDLLELVAQLEAIEEANVDNSET